MLVAQKNVVDILYLIFNCISLRSLGLREGVSKKDFQQTTPLGEREYKNVILNNCNLKKGV